MKAAPLEEGLPEDIDDLEVTSRQDAKIRGRYLADTYKWEINEARKIWFVNHSLNNVAVLIASFPGRVFSIVTLGRKQGLGSVN